MFRPVQEAPKEKKNPALIILRARLLKGARILGELYHAGSRCKDGFAKKCSCKLPGKFCQAKSRWLDLVGQEVKEGAPRALPEADGPQYVLEAMKWEEIEATGLTLTYETKEVGTFKVGPKGHVPWSMMKKLQGDVFLLPTIMQILETFPGSKVMTKEISPPIVW